MAWAINTKLGTHILYGSRLAWIDQEVKKSKVNRHGRTVASDHVPESVHLYAAVLPVAVAFVGLHVNTTANGF